MADLVRAKEPFRFYTRLHLSELTGLKAYNLDELLTYIKEVPGSCIYHHTHRFLQLHQYLSPEPPNDFAYWVTMALGEDELGERLASIDTVRYFTIRSLRDKIIETIEAYMEEEPASRKRSVRGDDAFHFIKSVSFVIPTHYVVYDLKEFADALEKVTIDSIYFHVFEARLRLERGTNDFAYWIETSLGEKKLAEELTKMDPYTFTMEDLRKALKRIIKKRIP